MRRKTSDIYRRFSDSLQGLTRRSLLNRCLDLVLALVGLLATCALVIGILSAGGIGFGTVNFIVAVFGLTVFVILALVGWTLRKEGLGHGAVARRLDRILPDAADRFHTAWFLGKRPPDPKHGLSSDLIEATCEWCEKSLKPESTDETECRTGLRISTGIILISAILGFFVLPGSEQRRYSLTQALSCLIVEPYAAPAEIRSDSGDITVARGSSALLWIERNPSDEKVLVSVGGGRVWREFPARTVEKQGKNLWEVRIPTVLEPLTYAFLIGPWASPPRMVEVVDAPRLERLSWYVEPPQYTCRLPYALKNDVWDLAVPAGTRLTLHVQADQSIADGRLRIGSSDYPLIQDAVKQNILSATCDAQNSGAFGVTLQNGLGLTTQSATGQVSVIADATPRVVILSPGPVSKIEGDEVVEVRAFSRDDYGVGKIDLVTERNYEQGTRKVQNLWTSETSPSSATHVSLTYGLPMKPFDLYPGDEVTFWLESADTDERTGPKTGRSDVRVIRFPSLAEVYDDLLADEGEQVLSFEELLDRQKALTEQAEDSAQDLRDRMEQKGEAPTPEDAWEERQELQDIKQRQEELQEEYKTIQEALQELSADAPQPVEEDTGFSSEIVEKVERIQELMGELLDNEGQELLQQIDRVVNEMAEKIDPNDVEDLAYSFKEYEEDLNRTLEQLEQAYQERQLEGLSRVAQDLERRQEALKSETERLEKQIAEAESPQEPSEENGQTSDRQDSTESGQKTDTQQDQVGGEQNHSDHTKPGEESSPDTQETSEATEQQQHIAERLAERQEQLRQDAESLTEALEQTAELLEEMNPAAAERLREASERMQEGQLNEQMRSASEQLQQMNLQMALQQQQEAQKTLRDIAKELQDMKTNMGGGVNIEVDFMAVEELFQRGLFLSNWNETLAFSRLARRRSLRSLEEAGFCRTEALRLASAWDEMARSNPFLDPNVTKEFRYAANTIGKAMKQGEGRVWIGYGYPQKALGHINTALWKIQQNMRELAQQMGSGSGQDLMEQLQQLAQQQRQLNNQSQQMQQQQGQNMLETIKRMAQQQAKLRQEIRELMQQYRNIEEMQSRLEGIAAEMEAIEKKMEAGELDSNLREHQDRVLTRMLEAQVSQEQDLVGRERRAEASENELVQPAGDDIRLLADEPDSVQVDDSNPESIVPPAYRGWAKTYLRELGRQGRPLTP